MFGSARTSNRNTWLHLLRHRLLKPTLRRRHHCHSVVVYVITVEVAMCESRWLCGCAIVCLSVGEAILGSCSAHGKMMMLVSIGNPYAARLAPGVWAVVQLHRVQRLSRSHTSGGRNVNRSSQRTATPAHGHVHLPYHAYGGRLQYYGGRTTAGVATHSCSRHHEDRLNETVQRHTRTCAARRGSR